MCHENPVAFCLILNCVSKSLTMYVVSRIYLFSYFKSNLKVCLCLVTLNRQVSISLLNSFAIIVRVFVQQGSDLQEEQVLPL